MTFATLALQCFSQLLRPKCCYKLAICCEMLMFNMTGIDSNVNQLLLS